MKQKQHRFFLWTLFPIALLFISCGGTSTSAGSGAMPVPPSVASGNSQASQKSLSAGGPQYLVKTLAVTMEVKDTRQVADALQTWISTTDPHATSEGMSYEQVSPNTYNITISFSVQANIYPQIQQYLRDYAPRQKGQLLAFQETVQDITNDYIDTQSRLKNLRGEQARLLDLMGHAQVLSDILAVEQRLTDVEGQIEQIEEHANDLGNQLHFYTITITLQPLGTSVAPPPVPGWSVGQVFHDAFAASLTLAQGLLAMLIWLLAFSIYIVPLLIISWFVYRWQKHTHIVPPPTPKS